MDIPTASNQHQNCEGEREKSISDHGAGFESTHLDADKTVSPNFASFMRSPSTSSETNVEKCKSTAPPRSPSSGQMPQKKKCVLELFPWLNEIENSTHKCLGSVTEVKSNTILNAMDFLIR